MWSVHCGPGFVTCWLLWLILNNAHNYVTGEVHLSASAPVNPVEHGGIFSLQCQVKDLPKGHRVEIYRHSGDHDVALSVDDTVSANVDERVFLAVRYMGDGSVVYFLSIIDITKEDTGTYLCKVIRISGTIAEVAVQAVDMSVFFFPSDTSPTCLTSDTSTLQVLEGRVLMLNCSSEKGNPTVDIQWTKTNGEVIQGTKVIETDDLVYATLGIPVTIRDNHAVFICEITSDALPHERRTCHIGPIMVIADSNRVPSDIIPFPTEQNHIIESPSVITVETDSRITHRAKKADCVKYCSKYSTTVFYWIISTAVCVVLGLLFFIFGVIVLLKFKEVNNRHKLYETGFSSARLAVDDIYAEVESKAASKPYMSLDRAQKCNPTLIPNNIN